MPEARLELTLPAEVWMGELSRAYPAATFRVLAAIPDGSSGTGLVEITAADVDALLAEMRDYEAVTEFEVLTVGEAGGDALVQFETSMPLLLLVARDSGIPLQLPFELSDGLAVWELTAPSDRLSELATQLRSLDIEFSLESLTYDIERESLLTDAQAEVVTRAIEMGYYGTPRQCSLTDLAGDLGLATSTVSETLHRAESEIITAFVDAERPAT